MKPFINEQFIFENTIAEELYHHYSKNLPIIDFHNHLSPKQIAEDYQFDNLGQVWLEADHYKWRAMRINGVDEHFCAGSADDYQKFMKWAETVPNTVCNPLYHWTHLELARYFDIYDLLSQSSAVAIYEETKTKLRSPEYSTRNLLKMMNVEMLGTTDDPADDLRYHKQLKNENFEIKVLPSLRADNVLKTENTKGFIAYIERLGLSADINITDLNSLLEVLDKRHEYFHAHGCRLSDSGPNRFFYSDYTLAEVNNILKKLLSGKTISADEIEKYNTCIMAELAKLNHKRGWVQQFHLGALRNNSTRKFDQLGTDIGVDFIGAILDPVKTSSFLNILDKDDQLCKTILYNLNPADNEMLLSMCGNFNDGSVAGKVQYGAAWWFLDQKTGMEKHLKDLSASGLLRHFVGMVTDSRSFLSFPRHEYFRRIACNFIGKEVEKGLIPNDESVLKPLIEGISYKNAKNYFDF